MKLTRDSRRFSVFFVKMYCLKGRKVLATKILVLATKPDNLRANWPQGFFLKFEPCNPARSFNFLRRNNIYPVKSTTVLPGKNIFKIKSITDSYLFSFRAMRRSLAIRAFTRAFR